MIAKDCTERLSAVALSIGLIIQRGSCVSGHVDRASFFSDTPPKCLHRDCVGGPRTGTGHGNVYLRVREKQGTSFTNSDISGCCFTTISRTRPPVQSWKSQILIPSKKPDLCYGKNWFPERAAEMESRSWSQLKGAWPNVCTGSK